MRFDKRSTMACGQIEVLMYSSKAGRILLTFEIGIPGVHTSKAINVVDI